MKIAALVVCLLALTAAAASATPVITWTLNGTPGTNGWFRSNVTVTWKITDPNPPPDQLYTITTQGCGDANGRSFVTADTPAAGTLLVCTATGTAPTLMQSVMVQQGVRVFIDRMPPTGVTAAASRAPDVAPWYTKPIGVNWSGADGGSGMASCTSTTYSGPELFGGPLLGTCTDRAGNTSAAVPFTLDYDATPPAIGGIGAVPDVQRAAISWQVTGATAYTVRRTRRPNARQGGVVYRGVNPSFIDGGLKVGPRYTYTLTAVDQAGNISTAKVRVHLTRLVSPVPKATVTAAPLLRWNPLSRADYYNVQLFRNGHKILSRWPRHHRFQLPQRWRFAGRRHHLRPGRYRWFVWPGIGPRSRNHYGRLLGTRSFTVLKS